MKTKRFRAKVIFSFGFFLLMSLHAATVRAQESEIPAADEISSRCLQEDRLVCHGKCYDGFGTDCYYDGKKFPTAVSVSVFQRDCFGYRYQSMCEPCANEFKIRVDGELKKLSCAEFYQKLLDEQKSCGDCLKKTGSYGG